MNHVAMCFERKASFFERPMAYVVSSFARVATMCVSDANKRFMLEYDG
eukprot:COSAG02_NODE_75665_length_143_cov_17.363636_1_plen_47_part_11